MGVPVKFNRYKRVGAKGNDDGDAEKDRLADVGEGEVGGGAGLTLIRIRLFKEVKKDEVRRWLIGKGRLVVIPAMLCTLLRLEVPLLVPSDILVARAL